MDEFDRKHPNYLRLTYTDNTRQYVEPSLAIRAGFNSLTYTHSFDEETGIITLTLNESATRNIANKQLGSVLPTVLRLRESNGWLEWAPKTEDTWTQLCRTDDGEAMILATLAAAAEVGKVQDPAIAAGEGVTLTISGDYLRFRAHEWKANTDLAMDCRLTGSSNKLFNITNLTEVASSLALTDVRSGEVWKGTSDDITPINMNGTYIGANHGYYIIAAIPNPTVGGLTEADIGSVWAVGSNQFVLVRIAAPKEANNTALAGQKLLWFCPYSAASMESGRFSYSQITQGATLTPVSGTEADEFTASAASIQCQFYIATNHYYAAAFLNGTTEIDLTKDGIYQGEYFDFYEEYDIIHLPTMLKRLVDAANGELYNDEGDPIVNDGNSHFDDAINESYVTFHNTYRYHKNGACVIYSSYVFHKDVTIGYIGGVQSGPFSGDHYVYVPGTTNYATPTLQSGAQIDIGKSHLADPDTLVSSYFQMTSAQGDKAMNLGFNPLFGTGVNDVRKDYIGGSDDSNLAFYYTSYKMYPRLIANTSITAGTEISCIAYRLPSYKTDDDFTAINWYWVGDDIYLSLHTAKAVAERDVTLPEYMNGMVGEIIEGSEGFTLVNDAISGNAITVATEGADYAIIKLTKPAQ